LQKPFPGEILHGGGEEHSRAKKERNFDQGESALEKRATSTVKRNCVWTIRGFRKKKGIKISKREPRVALRRKEFGFKGRGKTNGKTSGKSYLKR